MICQQINAIVKVEANHLANKYAREYKILRSAILLQQQGFLCLPAYHLHPIRSADWFTQTANYPFRFAPWITCSFFFRFHPFHVSTAMPTESA